MKSLKVPSRIVTLIVTIVISLLTYVATMQPAALAKYLPGNEGLAAVIIVVAACIVNQYSEEKRAKRAVVIGENKASKVLGYPKEEEVLNDEYLGSDDSDSI